MRQILALLVAFAIVPLTVALHLSAQTAQKTTAKKTTAQKTPAKKTGAATATAKKGTATKAGASKAGASKASASKTTARKGAKKTASRQPATTWRNRQSVPSADRYREIQNALVAKGYLQQGDATGQWDQRSADALKRFQADQSIEANGKLNSLSLIALGLGPKYEARAATPPPPAAATPAGPTGVTITQPPQ